MSDAAKAWEGAAEEACVRAEQLDSYATILEAEAMDGEERGVAAVAHSLLGCPGWDVTDREFVVVDWDAVVLIPHCAL